MNVYDFDGTIFKGDSAKKFYFFCLRKKIGLIRFIFIQLWYVFLYVIKRVKLSTAKEKFFIFYFSLSNEEREKFVAEFWLKQKKNIKDWYLEQKKDSDIIISASPSFLLAPIIEELQVKLIATDFDEKTGKIIGKNCKGEEKVERLRKETKEEINAFYSDSLTDKFLAKISNKAYYVSGNFVYDWPEDSLSEKEKLTKKQRLKKIGKISLISLSLIVGFMLICNALLIAVFALPTKSAQINKQESLEYLEKYSLWQTQFDVMKPAFSTVDNWTDRNIVYMSTDQNSDMSVIEKAMYSGFQYNNGYLIFIKPLFLILNLQQIRILNIVLQSILVISLIAIMIKKKLPWTAISFFIAYMFMSPYTIMNTMSYYADFYVTILAMFLMVLCDNFFTKHKLYPYFFLLLGATIAYFDMLMFTLVAFGFPFVLYCSIHKEDTKKSLKSILCLGFMWVIGYVTLILSKFLWLTILEKKNMFSVFVDYFFYRTGVESGRIAAIKNNILVFMNNPYLIMGVMAMIVILYRFIGNMRYIDFRMMKQKLLPFLFLMILPIAWYFIFANHSTIHYWYTYRLITISVFAFCSYMFLICDSIKYSKLYYKGKRKI